MKPIPFPEKNIVYAKNSPDYLELPAHISDNGIVTSCWSLNLWERLQALVFGKLWLSVLTNNQPLQPHLPQINSPFKD